MISVLLLDDEPQFLKDAKEHLEACGTFDVETRLYRSEDSVPVDVRPYDVVVVGSCLYGVIETAIPRNATPSGCIGPAIIVSVKGSVPEEPAHIPDDTLVFVKTGNDPAARYAELSRMIRVVAGQRAAQDGLMQANRKLNLLGSITRHDLLNKFSALQGYMQIIQEGVVEENIKAHLTKQEQILASIREQIKFAEDYQQIGIQQPTWHALEKLVMEVAATLPLDAHDLQVDLKNVEIFADPLLDRVFYNLMENTLRHGPDARKIRYSAHETPEGLKIVYEDDGSGIAEEDKENIFLRGFGKNTGLGLFLIREILMITEIAIRESGDPGEGARFEILVPKGYYRIPPAQE